MLNMVLLIGEILKRPTRADCKSADYVFAGSNPALPTKWKIPNSKYQIPIGWNLILGIYSKNCGSSSVGRASAFQAECRRFEPGLPLKIDKFCHSCEGRNLFLIMRLSLRMKILN